MTEENSMKNLKPLSILAILAILLGLIPAGQVNAQYKFSYQSTINIQNLSGQSNPLTITYYNNSESKTGSEGTTVDKATTTITLTAYQFLAITTLPVDAGFSGSVVVSSQYPVAVVSNISGNNLFANASYVGRDQGSSSVSIPLLMHGNYGYDTYFSVQNTSDSADANVQVTYSDGTSTSATIKPSSSHVFNQATESHNSSVFSATLTSSQPVFVIVVEESSKTLFAYNGVSGGTLKPVMPLINMNNYGYTSSIQVQNVGDQPTNVTVSYRASKAGSNCTETQTVAAHSSSTFGTSAFTSTNTGAYTSDCAKGSTFIGSAEVTTNSANQALVTVVNQHKLPVNGDSYVGFDASAATPQLVVPLLMDRNYKWFTSVNIMNVGDSTVDIHCDLTNTSVKIDAKNVAKGSMVNAEQTNVAAGWTGSGTCYAYVPGTTQIDSSAKIVGMVNELLSGSSDTFMVYPAINISTAQ
jgi:hypothetical protein